jgi:hypothetical protein
MERQTVITTLKTLSETEYSYPQMFKLYQSMMLYMEFIINNISNHQLINNLKTELQCVFNEARFGDDDDNSVMVYDDCIKIIKRIIQGLS